MITLNNVSIFLNSGLRRLNIYNSALPTDLVVLFLVVTKYLTPMTSKNG